MDDSPKFAYQKLYAKNDRSGNPRRLTAEYDLTDHGKLVAVYEHGAAGEPEMARERIRKRLAVELSSVHIPVSEFMRWQDLDGVKFVPAYQ